jgi:hypothetical protein
VPRDGDQLTKQARDSALHCVEDAGAEHHSREVKSD